MAGSNKKIAFITFGCRANQYDTSVMMAGIDSRKFQVFDYNRARNSGGDSRAAHKAREADVYVINTCTVTQASDFQCRQMVRRARKWNPQATIIVTGCLVETNPEALEGLPFDMLLNPRERKRLPDIILNGKDAAAGKRSEEYFYHAEGGIQMRTRALVKVQDGCSRRCAYCTVPLARGKSRSLEQEKVIRQLRALYGKGFLEAVITGVNLGDYGRDAGANLAELLERIDEEDEMPPRIRLSSIEPHGINEELIDILAKSKRICPHLHMPLQSGDDAILKRMRRNYTAEKIIDLTAHIEERIPGICIGMDVIAGLPGESGDSFGKTLETLGRLPFAYLHVFPYSPRPGTEAWGFKDTVPKDVVKLRADVLRKKSLERKEKFYRAHKGSKIRVLFEKYGSGWLTGLSDDYVPVRVKGHAAFAGKLAFAEADDADAQGITATIKD